MIKRMSRRISKVVGEKKRVDFTDTLTIHESDLVYILQQLQLYENTTPVVKYRKLILICDSHRLHELQQLQLYGNQALERTLC